MQVSGQLSDIEVSQLLVWWRYRSTRDIGFGAGDDGFTVGYGCGLLHVRWVCFVFTIDFFRDVLSLELAGSLREKGQRAISLRDGGGTTSAFVVKDTTFL